MIYLNLNIIKYIILFLLHFNIIYLIHSKYIIYASAYCYYGILNS